MPKWPGSPAQRGPAGRRRPTRTRPSPGLSELVATLGQPRAAYAHMLRRPDARLLELVTPRRVACGAAPRHQLPGGARRPLLDAGCAPRRRASPRCRMCCSATARRPTWPGTCTASSASACTACTPAPTAVRPGRAPGCANTCAGRAGSAADDVAARSRSVVRESHRRSAAKGTAQLSPYTNPTLNLSAPQATWRSWRQPRGRTTGASGCSRWTAATWHSRTWHSTRPRGRARAARRPMPRPAPPPTSPSRARPRRPRPLPRREPGSWGPGLGNVVCSGCAPARCRPCAAARRVQHALGPRGPGAQVWMWRLIRKHTRALSSGSAA